MLEGSFLDDDEDFNRELVSGTTAKENVEGKKEVYVCETCAKECVSSRGLKRHETLKHTREGTSKTKENCSSTLQISQFEEIIKNVPSYVIEIHVCLKT